jgi:hypothetical protein
MSCADLNYFLITRTPIPDITYSSCGCKVANGEDQVQYFLNYNPQAVVLKLSTTKLRYHSSSEILMVINIMNIILKTQSTDDNNLYIYIYIYIYIIQ